MKNIILFEGIASSGKTTLEKLLVERLHDSVLISENDTLMPIIDNKSKDVAVTHLQNQIKTIIGNPAKNVVVDRFHFTHAFRTQSGLDILPGIETELREARNALVVLLTIDPKYIKERIEETIFYRKDKWKKGAQGNIDEKVAYYTKQQEILVSLLSASHLPSITINTTAKSWNEYIDAIIDKLESSQQHI